MQETDGDNTLYVNLLYPDDRQPERIRYVEVDLEAVRSVGSIRVSYSYDRNAWIVEHQPVADAGDPEAWLEAAVLP